MFSLQKIINKPLIDIQKAYKVYLFFRKTRSDWHDWDVAIFLTVSFSSAMYEFCTFFPEDNMIKDIYSQI